MSKVELYKLQNNGSQEVVATCKLVNDIAICSGNESIVEKLNNEGITDFSKNPRGTVFPSDGKQFLDQMKHNFTSGYLNASDVIEE